MFYSRPVRAGSYVAAVLLLTLTCAIAAGERLTFKGGEVRCGALYVNGEPNANGWRYMGEGSSRLNQLWRVSLQGEDEPRAYILIPSDNSYTSGPVYRIPWSDVHESRGEQGFMEVTVDTEDAEEVAFWMRDSAERAHFTEGELRVEWREK